MARRLRRRAAPLTHVGVRARVPRVRVRGRERVGASVRVQSYRELELEIQRRPTDRRPLLVLGDTIRRRRVACGSAPHRLHTYASARASRASESGVENEWNQCQSYRELELEIQRRPRPPTAIGVRGTRYDGGASPAAPRRTAYTRTRPRACPARQSQEWRTSGTSVRVTVSRVRVRDTAPTDRDRYWS